MAVQTLAKKMSEAKARGDEPSVKSYESDVGGGFPEDLNWYSWKMSQDNSLGITWLQQYMADNGVNAKDLAAVKRAANRHMINNSTYSIARMLRRGSSIPADLQRRFEARCEQAIKDGRGLREEIVEKIQSKDNRSPAQRNRDRALEIRAELDDLFDRVWECELKVEEVKFFDLFQKWSLARSQAAILVAIYKDELNELVENLKEVPKKRVAIQKILIEFGQARQEALEAWATGSSIKKKTSKKTKQTTKRRSAVNVSTLKYKKTDDSLKVVSIDPQQIVGASMLVMYNTKYKQLTILRAASAEGLSIKGTTILNVDEKSSETKRAGRDANTIREMASATKAQVSKMFNSINSQLLEVRTRTSEEVVLVKALK